MQITSNFYNRFCVFSIFIIFNLFFLLNSVFFTDGWWEILWYLKTEFNKDLYKDLDLKFPPLWI